MKLKKEVDLSLLTTLGYIDCDMLYVKKRNSFDYDFTMIKVITGTREILMCDKDGTEVYTPKGWLKQELNKLIKAGYVQ